MSTMVADDDTKLGDDLRKAAEGADGYGPVVAIVLRQAADRADALTAALREARDAAGGMAVAYENARTAQVEAEDALREARLDTLRAADDLVAMSEERNRLAAQVEAGEASDGHHTHSELYRYRMLYNAHAAHGWLSAGIPVVKSWRHSDGEECFGGGWFIVTAKLPTGQVSNHYTAEYWGLFPVPEVALAPEWDGHTPALAADRLQMMLALDAGKEA